MDIRLEITCTLGERCCTHRGIIWDIRIRLKERQKRSHEHEYCDLRPQQVAFDSVFGLQGVGHQRPDVAVGVYGERGEGDQRQMP